MSGPQRPITEDKAREIAERDHPQWRRQLENDTLPEEVVDENGTTINPRMHLVIHSMVERQLAAGDPPGVVEAAQQLAAAGASQHEIRHEIGQAVANQLWRMLADGQPLNQAQYLAELQRIVQARLSRTPTGQE